MLLGMTRQKRRRGGTAVETALVMLPLVMFLFSVFEYGRLLYDWNLVNNAAREGCRYALANNTNVNVTTTVQSLVTTYMAGETASFSGGLTVTVTGTHNGASTAVNNLVPGDMVTVTVSGTYRFMNIIPLVKFGTFTMSSSCTMICEGAS